MGNNQTTTPPPAANASAQDDGFNALLGPLPAQPINPVATTFADKIAALGKAAPAPVVGDGIIKQNPSFTGTTDDSSQAVPDSNTPDTGKILENTAESVVGSTIAAGQDTAAAIGAPEIQKGLNNISDADQKTLTTILQGRQAAAAKGQDTTHWDNLIKHFQFTNGGTVADVFPQINKSNEEVIGDFAGTALDMLGGVDAASGLAERGASEGASVGSRIIKGVSKGADFGAGFGATGAMQQNESVPDILKSSAEGAVTGGTLGGATEGLLGKGPIEDASTKAESQTSKMLQSNVDALNPDLSGKKLLGAYKQVATGDRDIVPASIFKEQGLTPDQQTLNLGKRLTNDLPLQDGTTLSGVSLSGNHVKNLDTLGMALDQTESKLDSALKGDPEVNYNADKSTLLSKLDNISTQMPREFSAIRDSKSVFNNVIDFAKQTVSKAEDTIEGLRDARTSFDTQAQREYPNAFKAGQIDTSTPAGRAIKTARDTINGHLYDTAPNGSDIQSLIGREADIFRANETVAAKAMKGEGKNVIAQFAKTHPLAARALGYGATLVGGGVLAHEVGL